MIDSYVRKIHPSLIHNLFYETGARLTRYGFRMNEYDVSYLIYSFLNDFVKAENYYSEREKKRRFDNCIIDANSENPIVVYELKTYVKKQERIVDAPVFSDFIKLAKYKIENKKVKTYFVMVCTTSKIQKVITAKKYEIGKILNEHMNNNRADYSIDISKIKSKKKIDRSLIGKKVKLRPSIKKSDNLISCVSWEVKL